MDLRAPCWAVIGILTIAILWITSAENTDRPCMLRSTVNGSVCVCTADYCDTITRDVPDSGRYVSYVSSEAGLRFRKTSGQLHKYGEGVTSDTTLEIDVTTKYQTIEGFGGAVTDAAGLNWRNLTDPRLMRHLIQSYCSDSGLQYNMLRVPIGGTDYSTRGYAYNESPEHDVHLTNFTLSYEDYEYKIPMIEACMKASSAPIHILGATWSPPIWMKTNDEYSGHSRLHKEYLQTFADYHYKFIEKYAEAGIPVWGISLTNEPLHSSVNYIPSKINSLGWTLDDMSEYIIQNLGPTLRSNNSSFKDVKIISGDDLRFTITLYWNMLVLVYPETLQYLDGVAVHYYMNSYTPPHVLSQAMENYPGKFVIATEISAGAMPTDTVQVDLGAWDRAELYAGDIIENLSYNVTGYLDWNMCLNTEGGPSWIDAAVDSPVIVNATAGEFYKQPMFYAMGHFSKFVPRGSRRVRVTVINDTNIQNIAFLTPNNTVVVVIFNKGAEEKVRLRLGANEAELSIEAKSITTIEMLNESERESEF
uniref:Glucosylceramidase n=1 Tax=Heliothis virescens TaxID=7102 RepID=A0A2A4K975_HELVI